MIEKKTTILGVYTNSHGDLRDIVRRVIWEFRVIEGPWQAFVHTETVLPDPQSDNFRAFTVLEQDEVWQWIQDNTDLQQVEAQALARLQEVKDTTKVKEKPLPWIARNNFVTAQEFILVQGDSVILGPMQWNSHRFNEALETLGMPAVLPDNWTFLNENDYIYERPYVLDAGTNLRICHCAPPRQQPLHEWYQRVDTVTWDLATYPVMGTIVARDIDLDMAKHRRRNDVMFRVQEVAFSPMEVDLDGTIRILDTGHNTRVDLMNLRDTEWPTATVPWVFLNGETGTITKNNINTILQRFRERFIRIEVWKGQMLQAVQACDTMQQLLDIDLASAETLR